MRRRLIGVLDRLGLADAAFAIFQHLQALKPAAEDVAVEDLPVPPAYLRVMTAGHADAAAFLSQGRAAADLVEAVAARHDRPLSEHPDVLDFGCGCGRVSRYLGARARLSGCDINGKLVDWACANLPGRFVLSRQTPPLPYEAAAFDLVYATSVFTHMTEEPLKAWLAELARVVRPGGLALLSFFDEKIPAAAEFADRLSAEGFLIRQRGAEGSNLLCGYMTAEGFARRAAPAWRLVETIPSDVSGVGQAMAVFRRMDA